MAGSFNGLFGTITGVALGLLVALNIQTIREALESLSGTNLFNSEIYFLSKLPSEVHAEQVLVVSLIAIVISLLAAIYPAIKAAKLEPAEVLKHE
jgi:lipoprotein-releasing system permease protein